MARKQGVKMVDFKFVDTFGAWQHFSVHDLYSGYVDSFQAQGG